MKRSDFPFFRNNPDYCYLDSGATTQKPDCVIDAVSGYFTGGTANVHRAFFDLGIRSTELYESARSGAARLVKATSEKDIILTSGATESFNLAAAAWAEVSLGSGDLILTTALEHHSNILPWRMAAQRAGARIEMVNVTPEGELDLNHLETLLGEKPKLLAVTAVNNALGTVPPLMEISRMAADRGVLLAVDAAQAAAHIPVDITALNCAFLAFSGHKMYAPEGCGALFVHPDIGSTLPPWKTGGAMVRSVTKIGQVWNDNPDCFEAGTPNICGMVGFAAALEALLKEDFPMIVRKERELLAAFVSALSQVEGIRLIGNPETRAGAVGFNLEGVHPHDLAQFLNSKRIAVRSGYHCAQPLFESLGVKGGACRASVACYSRVEEAALLADALEEARAFFY